MEPEIKFDENSYLEQQLKAFPDPDVGSMFDFNEKSKMESTAPIKLKDKEKLTP